MSTKPDGPEPTAPAPFVTACRKLNQARKILHAAPLTKSGHNTFSNYYYFELGDFLPVTLKAFDEVGLCGLVSFAPDTATLTIIELETGGEILFTSPMSEANLKGCHPVQNLGAVETYQRRYLWSTAMEVIEGDPVDQGQPASPKQPAKPAQARTPQAAPKGEAPPRQTTRQVAPAPKPVSWTGEILEVTEHPGIDKNKKPYTYFEVVFTDGRIARTFSETLFETAQKLAGGPTVLAEVLASDRVANAWKLMSLEEIQEEYTEETANDGAPQEYGDS